MAAAPLVMDVKQRIYISDEAQRRFLLHRSLAEGMVVKNEMEVG